MDFTISGGFDCVSRCDLVVALVTFGTVACAAPPAAPAAPASEAAGGGEAAESGKTSIRISWWGGPQRSEKTNAVIDLFQAAYPDVEVEREARDWLPYWDKLNVESAANNQPCGIQMQSRFLQQFAPTDKLRPLDDLVEAGAIDLTGVAESYLQSGRGADGKLYMIPTGVFYNVVMYNKSMMEEAGLPSFPEDWTWEEFGAYAREAQPKLPDGVFAVRDLSPDSASFAAWAQSRGEPFFDGDGLGISKETMVDWLKYWQELRNDGVTYTPDVLAESAGVTIEDSLLANGKEFLSTKPANQLDAHQSILQAVSDYEEIEMTRVPSGPGGVSDDMGTNGISIGANCSEAQVAAAAAWINFFLQNDEAATIYASDNGVDTVDRLQDEKAADPNTTPGQVKHIKLLQMIDDDSTPTYYPNGYRPLIDALQRTAQAVAFGESTPEEAVDAFFAEADGIFGAN